MKLLNIGCGATRPTYPWVNLDSLKAVLPHGTPERTDLDREPNYVDHNLIEPMPFENDYFDGILASHVIEHFDCLQALSILKECHRILKYNGVLVISVPDASYFRKVNPQDCPENVPQLFGQPWPRGEQKKTFMDYALFFGEHKQVLSEDGLWCLMKNAGFDIIDLLNNYLGNMDVMTFIKDIMNRNKFSLEMVAVK